MVKSAVHGPMAASTAGIECGSGVWAAPGRIRSRIRASVFILLDYRASFTTGGTGIHRDAFWVKSSLRSLDSRGGRPYVALLRLSLLRPLVSLALRVRVTNVHCPGTK